MSTVRAKKDVSPKTQAFIERHGIILFVWFLLLVVDWMQRGTALMRGELKGNDDYMRMVEIRDWLDGQSWYDLHQYRLNPVEPLYSHWSRISDVLIGGPIKLLTPIFGAQTAELIAVIAYPSVLLLLFLYLVVALARKLSTMSSVPLATAFMASLSLATLAQFKMGRIDHHGLQIVMALAALWYLIESAKKPKTAIYSGILCGLGLYVGIESAPYVGAAVIGFVLVWVFDEVQAEKRMRYFGLALAATTVVCLLLSAPPSRWFIESCDALSIVYTQLTLAIALVLWGLSYLSRKAVKPWPRFFVAGALGLGAVALTVALFPQCLKGPYAQVDPRLAEVWLANVAEAGKFHTFLMKHIAGGTSIIILPIFTLLGYWLYHKKTGRGLSLAPRSIFIFLVMTLIAGLIQFRLMSFASSFGIIFAAYLLASGLEWAGKFEGELKRIALRLGLIALMAPLTIPYTLEWAIKTAAPASQTTQADANNADAADDENALTCISAPVLKQLRVLPKGTALVQIDLGSPMLKFTDLSVTSAPYHRNTGGNLAALNTFLGTDEEAKKEIANMKADYVIGCADMNESKLLMKYAPEGLLARLSQGYEPSWLEKLDIDETGLLLVYRVK